MAWRGRGHEAELVDDDDDDGAGEEHGAEHRHHKQGEVVEGGVAVAGGRGVLGRQGHGRTKPVPTVEKAVAVWYCAL